MTALAPAVTLDDLPEDTGRVMRSNRRLIPEDTPEADCIDGLDEWIVYGNGEPINVWATDAFNAMRIAAGKQRGFRADRARPVPPSIEDLKAIEEPPSVAPLPFGKPRRCAYFACCGKTVSTQSTSGLCKAHSNRRGHGYTEAQMWAPLV